MSQLTYPTDLTIAFPGMLADGPAHTYDILSRVWENATAAPAGIAVAVGTDPDVQADHAADAAGALLGVIVHSHANEVGSDDANLVDENSAFGVLHSGRVYVQVEEAVTPASAVYVRVASGGGGTQLGAFRASADTATARAASGMRYLTSAGIAGMAVVEVDKGAALS